MKNLLALILFAFFLHSCSVTHEHVHHHMNHHDPEPPHHSHEINTQFLTLIEPEERSEPEYKPFLKVVVKEFRTTEREDFEYYIFNDKMNRDNLKKTIEYSSHLYLIPSKRKNNIIEVLCPFNQKIVGTHHYMPGEKDAAGKLGCIGYIPHKLDGEDVELLIEMDGGQEFVILPGYLHFQTNTGTGISARYDLDDYKKAELIEWIKNDGNYSNGYVNVAFEEYDLNRGYYTIYDLVDKSKKN